MSWSMPSVPIRLTSPTRQGLRARVARLRVRGAELEAREAELVARNAELSRAGAEKDRFLASLSHELRTPLHSVIGFAELMHDGRLGAVSEAQRECLEVILSSSGHMMELIADVLDLERVEAGRLRLEPQEVDPREVTAECLRLLFPAAAAASVEIELDLDLPPALILDPRRLRQVLLNYVTNALKFSPTGSTVRVGLRLDRGELLVEVSDEGPGIPAGDQARAFGEFVQLDGSRGGAGLGLAITKRIIESQGGTVGVDARPGEGSTFFARLPVRLGLRDSWSGASEPMHTGMLR
jgi:signal transduction histidine kinase